MRVWFARLFVCMSASKSSWALCYTIPDNWSEKKPQKTRVLSKDLCMFEMSWRSFLKYSYLSESELQRNVGEVIVKAGNVLSVCESHRPHPDQEGEVLHSSETCCCTLWCAALFKRDLCCSGILTLSNTSKVRKKHLKIKDDQEVLTLMDFPQQSADISPCWTFMGVLENWESQTFLSSRFVHTFKIKWSQLVAWLLNPAE